MQHRYLSYHNWLLIIQFQWTLCYQRKLFQTGHEKVITFISHSMVCDYVSMLRSGLWRGWVISYCTTLWDVIKHHDLNESFVIQWSLQSYYGLSMWRIKRIKTNLMKRGAQGDLVKSKYYLGSKWWDGTQMGHSDNGVGQRMPLTAYCTNKWTFCVCRRRWRRDLPRSVNKFKWDT